MDLVTVRDSKVTSRRNSARNGSIKVPDSVDRQWLVNRFSIHLSGWVDKNRQKIKKLNKI